MCAQREGQRSAQRNNAKREGVVQYYADTKHVKLMGQDLGTMCLGRLLVCIALQIKEMKGKKQEYI